MIDIYTDASYNFQLKTAACGYIVIFNGLTICKKVEIYTDVLNPANAEAISIVDSLNYILSKDWILPVYIYTDSKKLADIYKINRNLHHLYFEETLNSVIQKGIKISINWIKGHSGNMGNETIDKICRSTLREYFLKQKNINNEYSK